MATTDWASLLSGGGLIATALGTYDLSGGAVEDIKAMGALSDDITKLGETAAAEAEFQPFTVTTAGGGTIDVKGDGGIDYSQALGAEEQAIRSGMLTNAQTLAGQTPLTAQDLYSQIQAIRDPVAERQRQQMEARLAAQGRLGTRTSMFGGTPEALAMEKALAEQQSSDIFQATQLAPQLEQARLGNIQGMLSTAYTPEMRYQEALTPAIQTSNISQSGRLGSSEALYKSGIAGLETEAAAIQGAATLESARVRALADALGMAFGAGMGEDGSYEVPGWLKELLG
jgi:hypothetical protein